MTKFGGSSLNRLGALFKSLILSRTTATTATTMVYAAQPITVRANFIIIIIINEYQDAGTHVPLSPDIMVIKFIQVIDSRLRRCRRATHAKAPDLSKIINPALEAVNTRCTRDMLRLAIPQMSNPVNKKCLLRSYLQCN